MSTIPPLTLPFSTPLFSSSPSPHPHLLSPLRATPEESPSPDPSPDSTDFDSRLSNIRLKYKSGTGKKAEARKTKKSGGKKAGSAASVYLPPVPLKEPVSGKMKVDFGFSPYSERINGRVAGLGLAALLLVELATGKSVIRYHSPSIIFLQVYFVAMATAIFIKAEKEKISVWPRS
ncbi:hypothetical protein ACET3Z_014160 [Daucus carota]